MKRTEIFKAIDQIITAEYMAAKFLSEAEKVAQRIRDAVKELEEREKEGRKRG